MLPCLEEKNNNRLNNDHEGKSTGNFLLSCRLAGATRSTADAVERPSPVNLLRAAVTGIGENTQM